MKKYCETMGVAPVDWAERLARNPSHISVEEWNIWSAEARDWITSPCGNQSELVPRTSSVPDDTILRLLSKAFRSAIACQRNLQYAQFLLQQIEKQSERIVRAINAYGPLDAKTYSEFRGSKPINWNARLSKDPEIITPEEWAQWTDQARCFVTCACGNQSAIVPRDSFGRPYDIKLRVLSNSFIECIQKRDPSSALVILRSIEVRSAELIKEIKASALL